jgi:alkylation response protein AidB-like acyl-CoA dehydrogenase
MRRRRRFQQPRNRSARRRFITESGDGSVATIRRSRRAFRPIFRRIQEGAIQRERDRLLPFEQIQWLKDEGFGAVRPPKEFGGRSATLPELFALLTELAEADSNLTQALRVHFAYAEDVLNSQEKASLPI